MSDTANQPTVPRAMIHKRILDVAADKPDAPLAAIAEEIPSATTDLVERVLDEYGDPADGQPADPLDADEAVTDQEPNYPAPDDLSDKQRDTLRVIHNHPEATQRDIADLLDVSAATVSHRMNAIEGFEWDDRRAFAHTVFDTEPTTHEETPDPMKSNSTDNEATVEQLTEQVTDIKHRVDDLADIEETQSGLDDLELTHKVIHACMKSENITEDEELRILEELLE